MTSMDLLRQAQIRQMDEQNQLVASEVHRGALLNHELEQSPYLRSTALGADPSAAARNFGEAREAGARGSYFGALAGQSSALTPGMASESLARAALTNSQNPGNNLIDVNSPNLNAFSSGTPNVPRFADHNYKHGKTRVPGQGDGTKDTVPSMLASGEAVLNKEAADHLGRGTIDLLNAIGLAKRDAGGVGAAQGQEPGMAAGNQEASGSVPGYADGTAYTDRINLMPGNAGTGTWGPHGDTPAAPNSGQSLRASLGIQGAQRPAPGATPTKPVKGPLGFNKGTSDVPMAKKKGSDGNEAARGQNGPTDHRTQGTTQGFHKGGHAAPPKGKGPVEKHNGAEPNRAQPAPSHDHVMPDGHVMIHPDVLRSLLSMKMGGGGGMPTPGSTQPLPMPMPMAAGVGQTPAQMGGNATRLPQQGGGQ